MDGHLGLENVPIINFKVVGTDINEYVKMINKYVLIVNVNVNQENTVDAKVVFVLLLKYISVARLNIVVPCVVASEVATNVLLIYTFVLL